MPISVLINILANANLWMGKNDPLMFNVHEREEMKSIVKVIGLYFFSFFVLTMHWPETLFQTFSTLLININALIEFLIWIQSNIPHFDGFRISNFEKISFLSLIHKSIVCVNDWNLRKQREKKQQQQQILWAHVNWYQCGGPSFFSLHFTNTQLLLISLQIWCDIFDNSLISILC